MKDEQPFLPYPLGLLDEDPENLFSFIGFMIVPKQTTEPYYWRARITIELLQLNREGLQLERAKVIRGLWIARSLQKSNNEEIRKEANEYMDAAIKTNAIHSVCARVYKLQCETDENFAEKLYLEAKRLSNGR